MSDAGSMILEQQPMKVAEAILLFLKGQGYFPSLTITQMSQKRHRSVKHQQDLLGNKMSPNRYWPLFRFLFPSCPFPPLIIKPNMFLSLLWQTGRRGAFMSLFKG